jgi:hypothetical protein
MPSCVSSAATALERRRFLRLTTATGGTVREADVAVDNEVTDERAAVEGSGAVGKRANVMGYELSHMRMVACALRALEDVLFADRATMP